MQRSLLGQVMTTAAVPGLWGVGEVIPDPCHRCGGDSRVRARREISVKIPAGVGDGMRVRLAAQGEVGPGGGPQVTCTSRSTRSSTKSSSATATICTAPSRCRWSTRRWAPRSPSTPSSTARPRLTIAAGTQPGSVTTLRGHGMPHLRSGVRGDLHAHIEVVVPSRLDGTDTDLLRKLKEHRGRDAAEGAARRGPRRAPAVCSAGYVTRSPAADAASYPMSAALVYVDVLPGAVELAVVDGDEGSHAADVRRIRAGEQIDLGDGAGVPARCVIEETAKGRLSARVTAPVTLVAPRPPVTVVQALCPNPTAQSWRSSWRPRPVPTALSPGRRLGA